MTNGVKRRFFWTEQISLHAGSVKTSFDAAEKSERPIAITHANPSDYVGFDIELNRRNKPTDLIQLVVERGRVIGLNLYPKIMRGGSNSTRNDFWDMVERSVGKFRIDAVGFGIDYYTDYSEDALAWWRAGHWARQSPLRSPNKLFSWPGWFRSPEDLPDLLEELGKRSFSESDIAKISGGNWLRLYKESFVSR